MARCMKLLRVFGGGGILWNQPNWWLRLLEKYLRTANANQKYCVYLAGWNVFQWKGFLTLLARNACANAWVTHVLRIRNEKPFRHMWVLRFRRDTSTLRLKCIDSDNLIQPMP